MYFLPLPYSCPIDLPQRNLTQQPPTLQPVLILGSLTESWRRPVVGNSSHPLIRARSHDSGLRDNAACITTEFCLRVQLTEVAHDDAHLSGQQEVSQRDVAMDDLQQDIAIGIGVQMTMK